MKTETKTITLDTKKQFELIDVTQKIFDAVSASGVQDGIVVVYNPHTTAAIRLNHNEPLLLQDIMKTLFRLVPVDVSYSHDLFELRENPALNERSNGHAHVKAFLLGSSETLIIKNGKIMLGEKQSLFFVEFDGGRPRDFHLKIMGD
jgi:secondary thiamine-phosphate synthase enzyme